MGNVKKLLVPIDFSPESGKALKYASSLAKQINAEIIALHVLDDLTGDDGLLPFIMPPEGWPFFGAEPPYRPIDVLLRERALDLWNFIDRTVRDAEQVKLKRLVRLGTVRKEIIAVAREENIDLVVLRRVPRSAQTHTGKIDELAGQLHSPPYGRRAGVSADEHDLRRAEREPRVESL